MTSNEAIIKSLEKIKEEIDRTFDFIHVDTDKKSLFLIKSAIDKLHDLKEIEFNIRKLIE